MAIEIVLVEPEIPQNTGNIARTCVAAGVKLHLIEPLGFSVTEKAVKRAGLDYWEKVQLFVWNDFNAFHRQMTPQKEEVVILTKNGSKPFWDMPFMDRLFLVFGSETRGLPKEILAMYAESSYYIPITGEIRCLNLSTSVGIALYESLRPGKPLKL